MRRDHESQLGKVRNLQPDAHVGIGQVHLCHVDGSVDWIGVNDRVVEAVERSSKLHRFGRRLLEDSAVCPTPRVVAD
jgi:hypothetical protein